MISSVQTVDIHLTFIFTSDTSDIGRKKSLENGLMKIIIQISQG